MSLIVTPEATRDPFRAQRPAEVHDYTAFSEVLRRHPHFVARDVLPLPLANAVYRHTLAIEFLNVLNWKES